MPIAILDGFGTSEMIFLGLLGAAYQLYWGARR